MKRSTSRWTTAVAAAALLGLPAAGWAQATPPAQPPTAATAQTDKQPGAAQEHLSQAKTALNEIPTTSVTGRARTQIAELKRHLTALERASSAAPATRTTAKTANANWGTEVAAMDKIITQLLDTTGAAATGTTGTTGTTAPKSKAATAVTLDDATRAKLMEVRTHITAYAAAKSGTTPAPEPNDAAKGTDPAATTAAAPPTSAEPPATTTPAQPPAGTPPTSTQPPTSTEPPTSAQPPATTTPAQPAAASQDTEAMRRHLGEARDTLSQLTQLPAAAQLNGEARTQVSQLIANFNELITTQSNWTASYAKVAGNLTALLGPDNTDAEPTGGVPTTATGTTGAVGTSGTTTATIDPAVRAKLVELRRHLSEFEKSAGGSISSATTTPDARPNAAAAGTMGTTGTTAAPTTPPMTTGSTSTTGTTGTTGSTTTTSATNPTGTTPATAASTEDQTRAASTMSKDDIMKHIEAMEAILGRDAAAATAGTTGTTGSTATKSTPTKTLSATEIDQLRMHLAELRKSIEKK